MIYITEMLRWGDDESHHYITGAYSTDRDAIIAGEVEKSWRGGKYEYRVVPVEVDKPLDSDQVKHHEGCY